MSTLFLLPYPLFLTILGTVVILSIVMITWKRRLILNRENGQLMYFLFCLALIGGVLAIAYKTIKDFFPDFLEVKNGIAIVALILLLIIVIISMIRIFKNPETRPLAYGLSTILGICILVLLYCFRYNIADLFQSIF